MPSIRRIASEMGLRPDQNKIDSYVYSQLKEAYGPLKETWGQLSRRLREIDEAREEIETRPEGEREHLLTVSDHANLPELRRDLDQARRARTAFIVKWYEKSQLERGRRVMDCFKERKHNVEFTCGVKEQDALRYLHSMQESARALEPPAYSREPAEQQQDFATAVWSTSPQAPAPAYSIEPAGQAHPVSQPLPYDGPSHFSPQAWPGQPAGRPPRP